MANNDRKKPGMAKKDLIIATTERLRIDDFRKRVTMPRNTFTITDRNGDKRCFYVRSEDKNILLSQKDVEAVINACLEVVTDMLRRGDRLTIYNFGVLEPHYRAPRSTISPHDNKRYNVDARYVPKFTPGDALRSATRAWGIDELKRQRAEAAKEVSDGECS